MIWVVLDTNTLVSGLGWLGPPSRVLQHVLDGRVILILSKPLRDELTRVLQYEHLAKVFEDPLALVLLITKVAVLVEPNVKIEELEDEPDNRVLEAALVGHADYIVTGDKQMLALKYFEGMQILTPRQFLDILESRQSEDVDPL